MSALPILYSFRRCPYAMRARMALWMAGITVELREVKLANKPPELAKASPKATVPVLLLPGGAVLDERIAIMRWALERSDPEGWLVGNDAAVIERNDGPFKRHLDRYKYPNRYPNTDPLLHRASGSRFIQMLSDRLKEAGRLSNGSSVFADIAIFPFIRQFRIADPAWFDQQDWPDLHRWLDQHVTSRAFIRCMMKYPLWKETGEEALFGADEH